MRSPASSTLPASAGAPLRRNGLRARLVHQVGFLPALELVLLVGEAMRRVVGDHRAQEAISCPWRCTIEPPMRPSTSAGMNHAVMPGPVAIASQACSGVAGTPTSIAGIARALRLGAQGVSLGTRFVASEEAWIHPVYKDRVVQSTAGDTFLGELFASRRRANRQRALRNKAFEAWDSAGRPAPGERPREGTAIGTLRLPWGEQAWA